MSTLTIPLRVPVQKLIAKLRAFPASAFDQTGLVQALLAEMPVEEASLAPYLTWDRQHYTRNLIDKTELYELMAICWEVGQCSSVHNHRDQNCWMAAPIGNLGLDRSGRSFRSRSGRPMTGWLVPDHNRTSIRPSAGREESPFRSLNVLPYIC